MDEKISFYLGEYRKLINFGDLTEKQNYKWINSYVGKFHKAIPIDEMVQFLKDAIDIHVKYTHRADWLLG